MPEPEQDALYWKWPKGWRSVHLPNDTPEDFKLEMELAELMSGHEARQERERQATSPSQPKPPAK